MNSRLLKGTLLTKHQIHIGNALAELGACNGPTRTVNIVYRSVHTAKLRCPTVSVKQKTSKMSRLD